MGMFGRLAQTGRAQLYPDQFAPGIAALQPVIASPQAPDVDPSMLATAKPAAPARRGMFGSGFLSWFTPERLQIIGAGMRQAGGVNGALDQELERQVQATAAASQQAWQKQQQAHQQTAWGRQDQQDAAQDAYGASLPQDQQPLFRAAPGAFIQGQVEAQAPLTRQQQTALDRQDRALNEQIRHDRATEGIDAIRAANSGNGGLTRLRGSDASQLTRIQQTGENSRQLAQLADQFEEANRRAPTGMGSDIVGYFGNDMAAMRQASSLMRGLMRPVGSGSTSDYEQRLYSQGAPDPGLPGPANQERIDNIRRLSAISNARQFFYENYADANGSLRGAEQAFQASDEYRQIARAGTRVSAGPAQQQQQQTQQQANGPVRVNTPADAQRLAPGTRYTTPDGRTFVR